MKYKFPVYVVHTDNVELIDGILWVEDQVLDDKNMSGETLGKKKITNTNEKFISTQIYDNRHS